jgi:hypothetical protein
MRLNLPFVPDILTSGLGFNDIILLLALVMRLFVLSTVGFNDTLLVVPSLVCANNSVNQPFLHIHVW